MPTTQIPIWDIHGIDRDTGKKRKAAIRAETEQEAVTLAGFVVESAVQRSAPRPRSLPKLKEVVKFETATDQDGVPEYRSLAVYASILMIAGGLTMAIAVLAGVLGAMAMVTRGVNILAAPAAALPFLLAGLVTAASGEVLKAVRDIARNSFRR